MKVKEYIATIVKNGKQEDMNKLSDMLDEIICKTKDHHPDIYEHYKSCLYEMAYGKKINKDLAESWVKEMRPAGQHWTMEEAEATMKSKDVKSSVADFYTAINMMYNDNYKLVKDNEQLAIDLAINWLEDEDAVADKMYEYYKHIAKRD